MPTFLHAADIHLDSPLSGLSRYEGAPVDEVLTASRQAFVNLVDTALERRVDLLLLAGDLYDGDWKDFQTGLFFTSQMTRLREAGVPVCLVYGNHDAQSRMTRSLRLPDNVTALPAGAPGTVRFDEAGLCVHGQSYARRDTVENLAAAYPEPVSGLFNIGLLHTAVAGAEGHAPYAPCTLEELRAKGYGYWALGHVHERRVLCEEPLIAFSGCIQGRNIREAGAKGALLVEVDDSGIAHKEFLPLDVMRWERLGIDAEGAADPEAITTRVLEAMNQALDNAEGRSLALRLEISGRCDAHAGLAACPEAFVAELRAATADASGNRAWLEKVRLRTRLPVDAQALRDSDTPQGDVLRSLDALGADAQAFAELDPDLEALRAKLGSAPAARVACPDLDDPDVRAEVLAEVRDLVLPLLADGVERDS